MVVIGIVMIYLCIHLNSVFLGVVSLIHIAMVIPIAICIYRYILQISFF